MRPHERAQAVGGLGGGDRAAQFAGAEKLTVTPGNPFSPANGTDWSICLWIALDNAILATNWEVLNTVGGSAAVDGWFVFVEATTQKIAHGYCDGTNYSFLATHPLALGAWYFVHFTINNDASPHLDMTVWDTTQLINSFSTGSTGFINPANQALKIGGGLVSQQWMKGRLDKIGIWSRPLTGSEPQDLWNGGAGLTGVAVSGSGLLTGLVDYYDLDEGTGAATWRSLLGTHNAAATGTVVSVPRAGQF